MFHVTGIIPIWLLEYTVADCVNVDRNWKWDSFSHLLPHQILLHISTCKPPCLKDGEDKVF